MAQVAFLKQKCVQGLEEEFFRLNQEAEVARDREREAAIKIQARCRGVMMRTRTKRLAVSANLIQRMFRGHIGRKRFGNHQRVKARVEREEYFSKAACAIQRIWRGYAVRKFTCDFYGRKKWLENVLKASEDLRVEMQAMYLKQLEDEEVRLLYIYVQWGVLQHPHLSPMNEPRVITCRCLCCTSVDIALGTQFNV